MKNWKIDNLDDKLLNIFQEAASIAEDACSYFDRSHSIKLSTAGRFELFLFNLFYSWKYLQDRKIISMTVDNAKLFITSGFMEIKEKYKDIDIGDFNTIYKDRFIHHNKELTKLIENHRNNKMYFPYYFYNQVDKDLVRNDADEDPNLIIELTNNYIHLINHLKTQLYKSFI